MGKFSTHLLDAALAQKHKRGETRRKEMIARFFDLLSALSKKISFKQAYIFGSITKPGHFSPDSDVDIGFVGLEDREFFKAMSFLSSESGIDVDIVQLEGHRFAEKIKREGLRWTKRPFRS